MVSEKIERLIEEVSQSQGLTTYENRTPIELVTELANADQKLSKLTKKFNNKKELKKQLELLNKIPDQKLFGVMQKIKEGERSPYFGHQHENLVDLEKLKHKFNLTKIKKLGAGYTTFVFAHPKDTKKILGFTVDNDKIKWMQANKKEFDFNLIDSQPYTSGNDIYIYTMKKYNKLYDDGMSLVNRKKIYEDVIIKYVMLKDKKGFSGTTIKDVDSIIHNVTDPSIKKILLKLKSTFPNNGILDLHSGQWGEDDKGNIVLFDPIISNKSVNKTDDFNKLGLNLKFSLFLSEVFDRSKSKEVKDIQKIITRK